MKKGISVFLFRMGLASLFLVLTVFTLSIVVTGQELQIAVHLQGAEVVPYWDPSDGASGEIGLMNNLYEALLRYDAVTNTFTPILAISYEQSEDAKTWTFKLREGVKFHTGNVMNAHTVKASIDRTIERGRGSSYIWSPVDSIEVVDDYTVRFHLRQSTPLDLIVAA